MDNAHNISVDESKLNIEKNQSNFLFRIGIAALIIASIGIFFKREQFFFSYLTSFIYYTSIGIASLFMVMIHHITRSKWGITMRRIPETISSQLFLWFIMLLPLLFGLHDLFHWTHSDVVESDPILLGKTPYLNESFFILRQILFFGVWGFLGYRLYELSTESDIKKDNQIIMRKVSAPGLVLCAFTVAFASFDWLMSLDPHWFSTMFGVYFFAMSFQAFFPFMILLIFYLRRKKILINVIKMPHIGDLGAWFFAFSIFYAYIAFSQYMLIYYANLPEEILWFYHRMEHGWEILLAAIFIGRFIIPFVLLMNKDSKRKPTILIFTSIVVLAMHFVEIYWIIRPTFQKSSILPSWIDIFTFIGIGGIFMGLFFRKFQKYALYPIGDPQLEDCLNKE